MSSWIAAQSCPAATATDLSGNASPLIDCSYPLQNNQNCLGLTVQYPQLRSTDSYSVSSVSYEPYIGFNEGTPLNANFDDVFAKKVTLPFNFCFYGNSYKDVVIGSNGLITFDTGQLGNVSYPNIQADNPSPLLPGNSVFGVLHDMVFSSSDESEIYYTVTGTAPCRKFIVNFYKGRLSGCTDVFSSSQIVLHEGTNIIEVFVDSKPAPCSTAKFKESLIGIMNATGSQGVSPSGRNTGIWSATHEAYRFSPNGTVIQPQFTWFNGSQQIGNTQNIQVCPQENSVYTVKVSYSVCGTQPFVLSDDIAVNFAPDFPLAKNYTEYFCTASGNAQNVNLSDFYAQLTPQNPGNLLFSFHATQNDANSGNNPLPVNQVISANTVYYGRIQNPSDPDCYRTCRLEFKFISESLITDTVQICDQGADGVENNFQLNLLNQQLLNSGFGGTVTYFLSQNDAENNQNAVTTANITASTQLWIRLNINSCSEVLGPVYVEMLPGPAINTPVYYDIQICDIRDDNSENYSFTDLNELISTDPDLVFEYYATYQQAYTGNSTQQIYSVTEGQYSIFVRVENPGGCFSIAEAILNVTFTRVKAENKTVYLCFNGTDDITFDLNVLSEGMLIDPLTGITQTYFPDIYTAVSGEAIYQIPNIQTITEDGNFVSQTYFIRFSNADNCYTIRELTVALVYPAPAKNTVEICDVSNDGTETVTLSNHSAELIGNQTATIAYFLTENDANNNANAVSAPVIINGSAVYYIRIEAFGCSGVYPVTFTLVEVPAVNPLIQIHQTNVCDNNADGTEVFDLTSLQSQIYSGSSPVTFTYYTNYDPSNNTFSGVIINPSGFLAGENSTVYVKVQFVSGLCYSPVTIQIQNDFLPAIYLNQNAELGECDYDFNLFETFYLPDALSQIFDASANTIPFSEITVTYYASYEDAVEGNASQQISETQVTELSTVTVWARFESNLYGCYSVAPIALVTYLPPKTITSSISVCDENFDGAYEVNLMNYIDSMVDLPNAQNTFTFYYSQSDAQNGVNAISNPENFSADPFPTSLWVRVEVIPGCFDVGQINFLIGNKVVLDHPGPFEINDVCDSGNDGSEIINLTQFESEIISTSAVFEYYPSLEDLNNGTNRITNPASYPFNLNNGNEIYVKVSAEGFCSEFVKIIINLKVSPEFTLPDYYFCPYNDGFVDIQPDFSGLDIAGFEWLDPSGNVVSTTPELLGVNESGVYTINVVGTNGCAYSTTFNVLIYEVPVITEIIPNGNSYTVMATGSQNILYSVDGVNWQISNVFTNLPPGVITFYVKFENSECLGLTKQGLILNIRNVFTPNADGINDTWYIDDLHVFDGQPAKIQIFDRYGTKVFEQQSSTKIEWNGFISGRKLPTASYWYILSLPDGRQFNGWILLKNRN